MTVCLCMVMVLFVGTVTQLSGTISVSISNTKLKPLHNIIDRLQAWDFYLSQKSRVH